MLKLIGSMLILLSGTLLGFHQAAQLAKRPRQIADLIRALQRLETEINYGFTPLPEALCHVGRTCPSPVGILLIQAGEKLTSSVGRTVEDIWQETLAQQWRGTSMKPAEREIFRQLGSTLGLSDREEQTKHLKLCALQLQGEEKLAREDQTRYERMWKSLGVLMGALVVILMY